MMKRLQLLSIKLLFISAFCFCVEPTLHYAQAGELYLSGNIGRSSVLQADVTDTFSGGTASGEATLEADLAFSGAVGRSFGNLRVEGELSLINSEFELINVNSVTAFGQTISGNVGTSLEGEYDARNAMVNVWYDLNDPAIIGSDSKLVPFLGVGIGLSEVAIDVDSIAGINVTYDETDTVFSYQIGAGVGYEVGDGTSLNFSYRYFATNDVEFDNGTDRIDMEFKSHLFLIGLLQKF